jgi:hypothetical protein
MPLNFSQYGTGQVIGNINDNINSYIDVQYTMKSLNKWNDSFRCDLIDLDLAENDVYLYLEAYAHNDSVVHSTKNLQSRIEFLDDNGDIIFYIKNINLKVDDITHKIKLDLPNNTAAVKVYYTDITANKLISFLFSKTK